MLVTSSRNKACSPVQPSPVCTRAGMPPYGFLQSKDPIQKACGLCLQIMVQFQVALEWCPGEKSELRVSCREVRAWESPEFTESSWYCVTQPKRGWSLSNPIQVVSSWQNGRLALQMLAAEKEEKSKIISENRLKNIMCSERYGKAATRSRVVTVVQSCRENALSSF